MSIQLAGCLIINDNQELLVLWKKKQGYFELPGGKIERGESREEAAVRECQEELGITVFLDEYVGCEKFFVDNKEFESHSFLASIPDDKIPVVNEPEVFEKLFWMPITKYKEFVCASNVQAICEKISNKEIKIK